VTKEVRSTTYLLLGVTEGVRMRKTVKIDPFVFQWKVNEARYRWATGIVDRKPHLVPRRERGKGFRVTEPSKEVFAEFARLDPTQDGIRGFADKYGDLFNRYNINDHAAHDGIASGGASLRTWQAEIEDMRVLFDLWDNIQNRRIVALNKIIRWEKTKGGDRAVSYLLKTSRRSQNKMLAHSRFSKAALLRFVGDRGVLLAARCALGDEINFRLSEHPTVPSLTWTPDYHQRIVFKPPHLLAAMWLQFAQAVTGEFGIKRCICGKFFQTGPGGRRADAITHSDACRQRKSRTNLA
jgi:hypothetical protein